MGRMKPHVTHILKNFREISGKRTFFEPNLVGQSFRWGTNGGIRFEPNGTLETTWVSGTYKFLGEFSVMASWAGFDHFLRFNSDFSEYQSVRLGDLEYNKGKRSMKFYDEDGKVTKYTIDRKCVDRINIITACTDAKIVISASIRKLH
jgi:hypothetical protein